jgi:hypothetical protein
MATRAAGKNRIMIFGPKTDGTYVIEFRTAERWSGTSESACRYGRTLRQLKKAPASLYRGFK